MASCLSLVLENGAFEIRTRSLSVSGGNEFVAGETSVRRLKSTPRFHSSIPNRQPTDHNRPLLTMVSIEQPTFASFHRQSSIKHQQDVHQLNNLQRRRQAPIKRPRLGSRRLRTPQKTTSRRLPILLHPASRHDKGLIALMLRTVQRCHGGRNVLLSRFGTSGGILLQS